MKTALADKFHTICGRFAPRGNMQFLEFSKNHLTAFVNNFSGSLLNRSPLDRCGFELWHHYFPAKNKNTGEIVYFFVDFILLNIPKDDETSLFGSKQAGVVYVGKMDGDLQFSGEVFTGNDVSYSKRTLSIRFGSNVCLEDSLIGNIIQDGQHHLGRLGVGHWGSISFELKISPIFTHQQTFPSFLPYALGGYQTYWNTPDLISQYDGHVVMNEEEFVVKANECGYGFRDKTWGSRFSDSHIKIYGGRMRSATQELSPEKSTFVMLCHAPVLWDYALGKKYYLVLVLNGTVYEFSHTIYAKQDKHSEEIKDGIFIFSFAEWNLKHKIEVEIRVPVAKMHSLSYPSPQNLLQKLLLACPISVYIKLFSSKALINWDLIDEITIEGAALEQR